MSTRSKSSLKGAKSSIRQSVTIPAPLAREVKRVAKERKVTMSRALVALAEQGVEAEKAAKHRLSTAYTEFIAATGPEKDEAGKELIRSIFGRNAIAEDPVR